MARRLDTSVLEIDQHIRMKSRTSVFTLSPVLTQSPFSHYLLVSSLKVILEQQNPHEEKTTTIIQGASGYLFFRYSEKKRLILLAKL